MGIIWKVGDRALFGYRPGNPANLAGGSRWKPSALNRIGKTGTIKRTAYQDKRGRMRVHFLADDGDFFRPCLPFVFPIINPPVPAVEHSRELVYVLK